MATTMAQYEVNQITPDADVTFDRKVGEQYVKYAHMLAGRGFIQSSLGNMAIRAPHSKYPDGVCYVKPNGVSLEEIEVDDLVITDVPTGRLLHGDRGTTVGHQMNREMLRLRPDIHCVIHLHHDETVALLSTGVEEIKPLGLTFPYLMQRPPHFLPAHINVENDVAPIKTFIHATNCVLMKRHGFTVLGRTVSECYHRVCILAAEVKRIIVAELVGAARGVKPDTLTREEMEWMYQHGDAVMYPQARR